MLRNDELGTTTNSGIRWEDFVCVKTDSNEKWEGTVISNKKKLTYLARM